VHKPLQVKNYLVKPNVEVIHSNTRVVGRLLWADGRFWIVRDFFRRCASEAKPTQNNTRDSLRTHLGVNLGTGHKTFERAGFRNMWDPMCKSFVEWDRRVSFGIPAGIHGSTAWGTNYCRQIR